MNPTVLRIVHHAERFRRSVNGASSFHSTPAFTTVEYAKADGALAVLTLPGLPSFQVALDHARGQIPNLDASDYVARVNSLITLPAYLLK